MPHIRSQNLPPRLGNGVLTDSSSPLGHHLHCHQSDIAKRKQFPSLDYNSLMMFHLPHYWCKKASSCQDCSSTTSPVPHWTLQFAICSLQSIEHTVLLLVFDPDLGLFCLQSCLHLVSARQKSTSINIIAFVKGFLSSSNGCFQLCPIVYSEWEVPFILSFHYFTYLFIK